MDQSNLSVSVIIPIYNYDDVSQRCIESIIAQTLESIEIIIIVSNEKSGSHFEQYAKQDNRIRILPSFNTKPGVACNKGLEYAKGKYIGFVYYSDWVEPNMYQELFKQAQKHDADVISGLFYSGNSDAQLIRSDIVENFNLLNNIITDKLTVPNFYLNDLAHWCSIYKRKFLNDNNIRFNEHTGATCPYIGFSFLVFSQMSSLFIYRMALYHHIDDNEKSSYGYEYALDALEEHQQIFKQINAKELDTDLLKVETAKTFLTVKHSLINNCITLKQRTEYLRRASALLRSLLPFATDNQYLSSKNKRLLKEYALHPTKSSFWHKQNNHIKIIRNILNVQFQKGKSYVKLFGFPLFFVKREPEYSTYNLFNLPLKRTKKTYADNGNTVKTEYSFLFCPLIKKIDDQESIKIYFLGMRIKKEINLQAQLTKITNKISELPTMSDVLYCSAVANAVAELHKNIFTQFKNSNIGKNIAIFGAGPSLNYAPLIKNCKTLACNRSIYFFKSSEPTYFFAVDNSTSKDYLSEVFDTKSTLIFLGRIINKIDMFRTISEPMLQDSRVFDYYEGAPFDIMRPEIEFFPLFNSGNIVFSALHFSLYTRPDTIYLLGCDTTRSGYYNKNYLQEGIDDIAIRENYKKMKEYANAYYPNIKIVSVNPVGLRGIFEDVYTMEFAEQDPDLDSSKIKIIDKI